MDAFIPLANEATALELIGLVNKSALSNRRKQDFKERVYQHVFKQAVHRINNLTLENVVDYNKIGRAHV